MATITEGLKELRDLRDQRDEANDEYKALAALYTAKEAELLEQFEDEDTDGVKALGFNFVPQETPYAQVQDSSEFIEWAKQHDDELIEDKPRKALLNQLVRQHLDDGAPLPPGLGFYVKKFISFRAA